MIRRPPRSTPFPTRRSSDLVARLDLVERGLGQVHAARLDQVGELAEQEGEHERADVRSDRKSTRLNSSHANISYAVFCLKKKKQTSQLPSLRALDTSPQSGS